MYASGLRVKLIVFKGDEIYLQTGEELMVQFLSIQPAIWSFENVTIKHQAWQNTDTNHFKVLPDNLCGFFASCFQ